MVVADHRLSIMSSEIKIKKGQHFAQ